MRKGIHLLLCALLCALLLLTSAWAVTEYDENGKTVTTEQVTEAEREGNDLTAKTHFFITIENEKKPGEGDVDRGGKKLPKTGDYGPSLDHVLLAAFCFGAGYLICAEYERRRET